MFRLKPYMALLTLAMIMVGLAPHHHHAETVCLAGNHAETGRDAGANSHGNHCIAGTYWVVEHQQEKCRAVVCNDHGHNHHPAPAATVEQFAPVIVEQLEPEPGSCLIPRESSAMSRAHSLRAPPVIS